MRTTIYKVTREEKSSEHIFVEATSPENAELIADKIESQLWTQNQDHESDLSAEVAVAHDLIGRIINRADGSHFNYSDEPTTKAQEKIYPFSGSFVFLNPRNPDHRAQLEDCNFDLADTANIDKIEWVIRCNVTGWFIEEGKNGKYYALAIHEQYHGPKFSEAVKFLQDNF